MTRRFTRSLMIFGFAIAAACTALRWLDPPVLQDLRNNSFDWYQRIYPRPPSNVPVRIVDIDERSLKELGQWPWPRDLVAELLAKLGERGAAVVAFDVIFSEPDRLSPRNVMAQIKNLDPSIVSGLRDNDEVFARQISGQPVVLGFAATLEGGPMPASKAGFAFLGQNPILAPPRFQHATAPLPALSKAAAGLGDISMDPRQRNAVVRTVPLFLSDGVQLYPSLEMEALRVAQGASTYVVKNAPERPASIEAVRVGNFEVPTTEDGGLWLYMAPESSDRYVSAWDVISGPVEKTAPLIEGNIVFVGTSAAGLLDIRATALAQNVPAQKQLVSPCAGRGKFQHLDAWKPPDSLKNDSQINYAGVSRNSSMGCGTHRAHA
jgi:adenylate cyclase